MAGKPSINLAGLEVGDLVPRVADQVQDAGGGRIARPDTGLGNGWLKGTDDDSGDTLPDQYAGRGSRDVR